MSTDNRRLQKYSTLSKIDETQIVSVKRERTPRAQKVESANCYGLVIVNDDNRPMITV